MARTKVMIHFERENGVYNVGLRPRKTILKRIAGMTTVSKFRESLEAGKELGMIPKNVVKQVMNTAIHTGLNRVRQQNRGAYPLFITGLEAKNWTAARMLVALGLVELSLNNIEPTPSSSTS